MAKKSRKASQAPKAIWPAIITEFIAAVDWLEDCRVGYQLSLAVLRLEHRSERPSDSTEAADNADLARMRIVEAIHNRLPPIGKRLAEEMESRKHDSAVVLQFINTVKSSFDPTETLQGWPSLKAALERLIIKANHRRTIIRSSGDNERNRWFYEERFKGTPDKTIVAELKRKASTTGWRLVSSEQGMRKAATKYAEDNQLPPIPPRRDH